MKKSDKYDNAVFYAVLAMVIIGVVVSIVIVFGPQQSAASLVLPIGESTGYQIVKIDGQNIYIKTF